MQLATMVSRPSSTVISGGELGHGEFAPTWPFAQGQRETTPRLRLLLVSQGDFPVEARRLLTQRRSRALQELEFDLANLRAALLGSHLANVQRRLDHGFVVSADPVLGLAPRHVGNEDRAQFAGHDQAYSLKKVQVFDLSKVRTGTFDRHIPLAAPKNTVRTSLGLDGLVEALTVLADPQREATPPQAKVLGIVVGTDEMPVRGFSQGRDCPIP